MKTGLFNDKKVLFVVTAGGPPSNFSPQGDGGLDAYLFSAMYPFRYTGMKILSSIAIYGANSPKRLNDRNHWIEKFKIVVLKLDNWKIIPFDDLNYQILSKKNPETLDSVISEENL